MNIKKLANALQKGIKYHQKGQLQHAESIYRDVLKQQPDYPDALHLLGVLAHETQHHDMAVKLISQALARDPGNATYYCNLGNVYKSQEKYEAAIEAFRQAVHYRPDYIAAYNNLGNTLSDIGQSNEAINTYREALKHDPGCPALYNNLDFVLEEIEELDDALFNYRKALTLGGDNPDICNNVGNVLFKQSLYAEAIQVFHDIIKNYSEDPAAYLNLGNVLVSQDEHRAALPYLSRAVQLDPGKLEAHCSLGNELFVLGDASSAATSIKRALQINPESVEAHNNMGCVSHYLGRYEDAREHYQRAIEIQADYADAIFNLSLIKLLQGDLVQGWAGYEYGLLTNNRNAPELPFRRWSGVPTSEHTILVYNEQGVGDEIMFASCLPDLIEVCPQIILACNRRLHTLFFRSFPEITVIDKCGEADEVESWLPRLTAIDEYIPAGSLPKYFRPNIENFPRQQSYLVPDQARVGCWRDRYKALGPGLKVGISWQGGNKPHVRALRSIALTQWREILAVAGAQFINLQYGDCQAELADIQSEYDITVRDWRDADPLKDMDDFAAQVAALDLIISVDNTTVHMAGALGVPVWALLPSNPEWRWMLGRKDSLWYQMVRLYRQPIMGDWKAVISQVAQDLDRLAK